MVSNVKLWSLQWRHNGRDGVSNHRCDACLINRLFRCRLKKTSKFRVIGFCEGNSPVIGEFPAQKASNEKNASIWWRHHVFSLLWDNWPISRMAGEIRCFFHPHIYLVWVYWTRSCGKLPLTCKHACWFPAILDLANMTHYVISVLHAGDVRMQGFNPYNARSRRLILLMISGKHTWTHWFIVAQWRNMAP